MTSTWGNTSIIQIYIALFMLLLNETLKLHHSIKLYLPP